MIAELTRFLQLIAPQAPIPQNPNEVQLTQQLFVVIAKNLDLTVDRNTRGETRINFPQRVYTLRADGTSNIRDYRGNWEIIDRNISNINLFRDCFRAYCKRERTQNLRENQEVIAAPDDEFLRRVSLRINTLINARPGAAAGVANPNPVPAPVPVPPQATAQEARLIALRQELYRNIQTAALRTQRTGEYFKTLWNDPAAPYIYENGRPSGNPANNLDENTLRILLAHHQAKNLGNVARTGSVGGITAHIFTDEGYLLYLTEQGKLFVRQDDPNDRLREIDPQAHNAAFERALQVINQQINARNPAAGIAPLPTRNLAYTASILCKKVSTVIRGINTNLYEFDHSAQQKLYYSNNGTFFQRGRDGRYSPLNPNADFDRSLEQFLQRELLKQEVAGRDFANELARKRVNNIAIENKFLQEDNLFFLNAFFEQCHHLGISCNILLKPAQGPMAQEEIPPFLQQTVANFDINPVRIHIDPVQNRSQDIYLAEKLAIQNLHNPRQPITNTFVISENINVIFQSPESKARNSAETQRIRAKLARAQEELAKISPHPLADKREEKKRSEEYNKAWAKVETLRNDIEKIRLNTDVLSTQLAANSYLVADPTLGKLFFDAPTLTATTATHAVSYLRENANTHAQAFHAVLHTSPTIAKNNKAKEQAMASGVMENSTMFSSMFHLPGFYSIKTARGEYGFGVLVDGQNEKRENYVFYKTVITGADNRTKITSIITDPEEREYCKKQLNLTLQVSHNYINNFYKVEDYLIANKQQLERNNGIRVIPYYNTVFVKDDFHPIDVTIREGGKDVKKTVSALKIEVKNQGGQSEFYMLYQKGGGIHRLKGEDEIPGDRLYGRAAIDALAHIAQRAGIALDQLRDMQQLEDEHPRPATARTRVSGRRPAPLDLGGNEQDNIAIDEYDGPDDNYTLWFIDRYARYDGRDNEDFLYTREQAVDRKMDDLLRNGVIGVNRDGSWQIPQKLGVYAEKSALRKLDIAIETQGDQPLFVIENDQALEAWVQRQSGKKTPIFYPTPDRPHREGEPIAYKFRKQHFVNMHFENVDFRGSGYNLFLNCTFGKGCIFPTPDQDFDPRIPKSDRYNYMQTKVRPLAEAYERLNIRLNGHPNLSPEEREIIQAQSSDQERRELALLGEELDRAKKLAPKSPYDELVEASFSNCTFTPELLNQVAGDESQKITYRNIFGIHDFTHQHTKAIVRDNQKQRSQRLTFSDTHVLDEETGKFRARSLEEIQEYLNDDRGRQNRSFQLVREENGRITQSRPDPITRNGGVTARPLSDHQAPRTLRNTSWRRNLTDTGRGGGNDGHGNDFSSTI